jgi:hypothetical protein
MGKEKSSGMKSALEIAMARVDRDGGAPVLSDGQKRRIAEVERTSRAGIAEIEIMTAQRLLAARAGGDMEAVERLEAEQASEIARLRRKAEKEKKEIRGTDEASP